MLKKDLEIYAKKLGVSHQELIFIVQKHLGLSKTEVFVLEYIPKKYENHIISDIQKIEKGIPLEYIREKAEFFSLDFYVDNRVLIPRNDTEVLVEEVLKSPLIRDMAERQRDVLLIDVGTGSGAIPISILKNSSIERALAIDISTEALEVAKKNIQQHKLEKRLLVEQSNLLGILLEKNSISLWEKMREKNNNIIITANLPYIKNNDFENMDTQTIQNEPHLALFGGQKTGFELYETLIFQVFELIKLYKIQKILLFIEIGFDQKVVAETFLTKQKLAYEIYKDNSGIDRCIKIIFDF